MFQESPDTEELLASASVLLRRLEALDHAARSRTQDGAVLEDIEGATKQLRRLVSRLGGADDLDPEGLGSIPLSASIARIMVQEATGDDDATASSGSEAPNPSKVARVPEGTQVPCLVGNSQVLDLPELLELLAAQQKTGILKVETELEDVTVHLHRGKVVHASSDRAPRGDRLGDLLVELGFVSQERLDAFLRGFAGSGRLLGEVLATGSVVDADQLQQALTEQVQRLFNRMFQARGAQYRFVPMDVDSGRFQRVEMGLRFLLLESARQFDESRLGAH